MIIWLFILIGTLLLSVAGVIFLMTRVYKFTFVDRMSKGIKSRRRIISMLITVAFMIVVGLGLGFVNLTVIMIHLALFWLIFDLVFWILPKYSERIGKSGIYLSGICTLIFTMCYLGWGFYNAHHVFVTNYTIETSKDVEALRIVQFADSHMGTTFDGEGFAEKMELVQSLNPDVVLISGDYIDGSSKYEDVITATKALGELNVKYGIYFSYGNHDKNFYGEEKKRNFSEVELIKELEANNVTVLSDEIADLGNGHVIIGRQDKTISGRMPIADLVQQIDADNSFSIDLNHQPNDYDNEEAAGVDLVLSGHTHGGQFFPINEAGVWLGENDKTYGYEKRGNTNFIVTSGISDWALDFKTGCVSEIVVIDVVPLND